MFFVYALLDPTKLGHSLRQLGPLNHRYGKHWSDEEKEKRRQFNLTNGIKPPDHTGMKHSEETKEKMRLKALGKVRTEEHRKNISLSKSGENHPNWGKTLPEERKEKIRQANILAKQRHYQLSNGEKIYNLTSHSLREFCKVHQISWDALRGAKRKGIAYKGWILTQILDNHPPSSHTL